MPLRCPCAFPRDDANTPPAQREPRAVAWCACGAQLNLPCKDADSGKRSSPRQGPRCWVSTTRAELGAVAGRPARARRQGVSDSSSHGARAAWLCDNRLVPQTGAPTRLRHAPRGLVVAQPWSCTPSAETGSHERYIFCERACPPDSAHVSRAAARQHPGRLVHLGHQHPLPAGRWAQQLGGVRGQRLLHGRHGDLRGADRGRGRHVGPADVVSAGHAHAVGLDVPLLPAVGDQRGVLAMGRGLDAARAGVHLLLRRGRGLAGRRAALRGVRGRAGGRARTRPDDRGRRDARRLGGRRSHRAGNVTRRALPAPGRRAAGDVRRGLPADARPGLRARPGAPPSASHACSVRRLARVRAEEPARALGHARRTVRLRRRHLHVLRVAAVPPGALRRSRRVRRGRPRRRDRRRLADPGRLGGAEDPRPVREAHDRADPGSGGQRR